ncbi:MAG: enoyl-CoA hydratase/isomerase family protein, partial [Alphaproteobacteria bacterium]
ESGRLEQVAAAIAEGVHPDAAIAAHAGLAEAGALADRQEQISDAFGRESALACVERLEEMAEGGDEWAVQAVKLIARNSPRSVAAAFRAIHMARTLSSLEDCLALEYRFAYRALLPEAEFLEGIRAMVIDKDRAPKWRPATLREVTPDMVDAMLAPLGEKEWTPE